ncbi:hypothetical protein [Novosphingobium kaempferiae]|uniref:hypothetical protein n=1 Tax=Novosphingobium kaempferiae TaxID=2896849 RepID=UPI001E32A556|nr:hypothetical protein [Novosphingobium kaempferiae]
MSIVKRRRRVAPVVAIIVPVALIALGVAAWNDAGKQPVTDQTIAVPLPPLSKGDAK